MQIPDEIRKSVVFLGYSEKVKGDDSIGKPILKGTGFFVGVENDDNGKLLYLVTAHHIIAKIKEQELSDRIVIRINKKEGGFDHVPVPIGDFIPHPSYKDIAVLLLTPKLLPKHDSYDFHFIPDTMLVTKEMMQKYNISLGDEVFTAGLFILRSGERKNIPIIRVGNIAAMPEEPINETMLGKNRCLFGRIKVFRGD